MLVQVHLIFTYTTARGVSKKFGEGIREKKQTEDTNFPSLAFKIITILLNTLLATFIQLLETQQRSLGIDRRTAVLG